MSKNEDKNKSTHLGNVYYNAVSTEHGNHAIAVGWTTCGGVTVTFEKGDGTATFRLSVSQLSEQVPQVITPFRISAEIPNDVRSINVRDDHGEHQVCVRPIQTTPTAQDLNDPGEWIESNKKVETQQ